MFERDLSRTTLESLHYSVASLHHTDLRPRLQEIRNPTLGIYGRIDRIVHPGQRHLLADGTALADIQYFRNSGHFPALDEPELFYETPQQFLNRGSV